MLDKEILKHLSKNDPIVERVVEHYVTRKRAAPINAQDVKHFWEKVGDISKNIGNTNSVK